MSEILTSYIDALLKLKEFAQLYSHNLKSYYDFNVSINLIDKLILESTIALFNKTNTKRHISEINDASHTEKKQKVGNSDQKLLEDGELYDNESTSSYKIFNNHELENHESNNIKHHVVDMLMYDQHFFTYLSADTLKIKNLHEFTDIKFNFIKLGKDRNIIRSYKAGDTTYYIAENFKLYTIINDLLVEGIWNDRYQIWAPMDKIVKNVYISSNAYIYTIYTNNLIFRYVDKPAFNLHNKYAFNIVTNQLYTLMLNMKEHFIASDGILYVFDTNKRLVQARKGSFTNRYFPLMWKSYR